MRGRSLGALRRQYAVSYLSAFHDALPAKVKLEEPCLFPKQDCEPVGLHIEKIVLSVQTNVLGYM